MERQNFCDHWTYGLQGEKKEPVVIPHDAMQYAKRSGDALSGSGEAYYHGGIYVYEKTFNLPEKWREKEIYLQFEGVYRKARVSVNGQEAGGCCYGYLPFFVNITPYLRVGENQIEVVADNSEQPNSRWYTGGGIYRPVWLLLGEKEHILPEGVKVETVSYKEGKIKVSVETNFTEKETAGGNWHAILEICEGKEKISEGDIAEFYQGKGSSYLTVPEGKLWSEDQPNLYECRVILQKDGRVLDRAEVTFGIREITWDNHGLYVNGESVLLKGGCIHHDNGILGAASFAESEWRKVRMLKNMGFNAIRSAHNPANPALMEACDYYGVYLIDEMWDMWYNHKTKYDYASDFVAHYETDIEAVVQRDFNHPSVIMYSIGNEVSEPGEEKGIAVAHELIAKFHRLDRTRPVTGGMNLMIIKRSAKRKGIYDSENGGRKDGSAEKKTASMNSTMFNLMTSVIGPGMNKAANGKGVDKIADPVMEALDISGYNYASGRYGLEEKRHPDRLIYGSETFPYTIYENWQMVKKYPYLAGDFMWTAIDYLGEAGIGAWAYTKDGKGFSKPYPWKLADTGAIDIIGTPNAELFQAQAAWDILKKPVITVRPINHPGAKPAKAVWRGTNAMESWSFAGCDGNKAEVEVYTSDAWVELFINGKKAGRKPVKKGKALFRTRYESGVIYAVAYDRNGNKTGENSLTSAKGALSIRAEVEKNCVDSKVRYVNIAIVGENGVTESNADVLLHAAVTGGKLLALGSANPRTEDSFVAGTYHTYYGKAQAIILLEREDASAELTLDSQSPDHKIKSCHLTVG